MVTMCYLKVQYHYDEIAQWVCGKEGNVLFNDALNTLY